MLLLILIVIRLAWAAINVARRPASINLLVKLGHLGLYVFLLVTPVLGLLRQYGSGRAFELLGIPLFPGFDGDEIAWMVEPGNALHGLLCWLLLAMIVGHIIMVIYHRKAAGQPDVVPRMWGGNRES